MATLVSKSRTTGVGSGIHHYHKPSCVFKMEGDHRGLFKAHKGFFTTTKNNKNLSCVCGAESVLQDAASLSTRGYWSEAETDLCVWGQVNREFLRGLII